MSFASVCLLACVIALASQPSRAAIKLAAPTTISWGWKLGPATSADIDAFGWYEKDSSATGACTQIQVDATNGPLATATTVLDGTESISLTVGGSSVYYIEDTDDSSVPANLNIYVGGQLFSTLNNQKHQTSFKTITKIYTESTCKRFIAYLSEGFKANQLVASDPVWTTPSKAAVGGSAFILMGISVRGDSNNGQSVVPCGLPATFQFTSKCGAGKAVLSSFVLSPVSTSEYVYVPDQTNGSLFVFQGTCSITVGSDVIPLNAVATHPAASTFYVDLTPGTFVNDLSGAGNLRLTFLHVSSMFRSYW